MDLQKNSCSYNCTDFVFSPCFCIIKGLCKMGVILVRCTGIMRWAVLSHFSPIQLFVTLWTGPPGSSVHWILQARILEWVAVPFSRGIFSTQGLNLSLRIAGRFFTAEPSGKPCVNQLESSVSWLEREVRDSWETQNPIAAWKDLGIFPGLKTYSGKRENDWTANLFLVKWGILNADTWCPLEEQVFSIGDRQFQGTSQ